MSSPRPYDRKPYCVVLLDEVEKAHPDVMELFFQVFDKGTLEDGEGRVIDFKNTVILLTSNVGTETTIALCADEDTTPNANGLVEALRPELLKVFPTCSDAWSSFRTYPISDEVMKQIVRLQLNRIVRRVRENHKAALTCSDEIVANIASRYRSSPVCPKRRPDPDPQPAPGALPGVPDPNGRG